MRIVLSSPSRPSIRAPRAARGHVASRFYPAGSPSYVSGSRPSAVSLVAAAHTSSGRGRGVDEDFSGPNTEAPGYPSTVERSRCGSVSTWSDWQGLSPLSSLSYSPVRFIAHTPGLKRPSPTLTGRTLPTPDELNKPLRDSHPLRCKKRGVAWTPRAGLGLLLAAITRFDPHDLEGMTPRGVSPSPLSLAGNPESWLSGSSLRWDRTQRLTAGRIELGSSSRTRGLRLRASLAPDKPLSRHPALRVAAHKRVVSPEPFSQFGDRPSRACCSQNPQRSACVSTPATVEARPPRPRFRLCRNTRT